MVASIALMLSLSAFALPSPKRSFGFAQAGKAMADRITTSRPPELLRRRIEA
jgi:hypothetical protein